VFTRSLDDITARPGAGRDGARFITRSLVLDGEVIALPARMVDAPVPGPADRDSRLDVERLRAVPLTPFLFDVLHVDGGVVERPANARRARRDKCLR
jgi:DNA ligase-1